ncbi:SDR family NAD(P)-dependent oxidoreductase [Mixta intestinalis]|jgi:3-oxoacyl-[acyl-carrier protein] reductase|uniref:3-oxoacyl-[acyl-carrier-protein] reductase FabG n=1 Tax=Mixta intestinalis TaxID=1615494 RepID=A0A6P1PU58_9GAMM|nr:SDR family oxidoreductase [Mixta intestinalis]QHM69823.1 3-oxoacyl-[acyl-carrier-protein] reductase FabG [Mixta intestinalis]
MKRHALVTGASSGIGRAIVERLLREGWQVTGLSRTASGEAHPALRNIAIDLYDEAALAALLPTLPAPDAFIHAAGIMQAAELGALDSNISKRLWHLHVRVAEFIANGLIDRLPGNGRIVLIGSRTSRGAAGRSQYVATKAAITGMARSWAAELAPRGVTVNVVAPGATETPMLKQPGRASSPPQRPPIGRYIQPDEVAALVSFLLSHAAAAITGQEIVICGGASLS